MDESNFLIPAWNNIEPDNICILDLYHNKNQMYSQHDISQFHGWVFTLCNCKVGHNAKEILSIREK